MIADIMLAAAIVLAVLSPMTGSFLKCWADRARSGASVSDGRSFCDNCGKTLTARDLIPVFSWLIAGGKSRCCREPISPTLLLAEVAALTMAVTALIVLPQKLWLPALLIAWGLQALALLTGAHRQAALVLAMATTLGALILPAFTDATPVTAPAALVGGGLGLGLWLASRRAAPRHSDAALLLPSLGALLGPVAALPAIGIGVVVAFFHGWMRSADSPFPPTSLAIGLATGTWVIWIGLFLW